MRKLLMLVVAVLAMTAFAAVPASADRLDPNPTFPHADPPSFVNGVYDKGLNPEDWAAANVMDAAVGLPCEVASCAFDDAGFSWASFNWSPSYGAWDWGSCTASIVGGFDASGDVDVTDGEMCILQHHYAGPSGLPWSGQTCVHVPTGEAWVRLWTGMQVSYYGSYDGEMFGRVDGDHVDFSDALFNTVMSTSSRISNTADFPLESELLFEARLDENYEEIVPCSWPEFAA